MVLKMAVEGEVGIEDILGEIRTVMLSIPCPYCGKVPNEPVKPGMKVQCTACGRFYTCLLYTSPSPRDLSPSRMPSSA